MPADDVEVLDVDRLGAPSAKSSPYDPRPPHDAAQRRIAYALVGTLTVVIAASFVGLWFDWFAIRELETLMTIVFGPLVGLVGAVTGFYYGGKSSS